MARRNLSFWNADYRKPVETINWLWFNNFWVKLFQRLMTREENEYILESVWQCDLTSFKLWPHEVLSVVTLGGNVEKWTRNISETMHNLYTSIRYDLLRLSFKDHSCSTFFLYCLWHRVTVTHHRYWFTATLVFLPAYCGVIYCHNRFLQL